MSIVVRLPPSNVTRQQYDAVRSALTESGDWPADGCQFTFSSATTTTSE
jgi:hypothetical protein